MKNIYKALDLAYERCFQAAVDEINEDFSPSRFIQDFKSFLEDEMPAIELMILRKAETAITDLEGDHDDEEY